MPRRPALRSVSMPHGHLTRPPGLLRTVWRGKQANTLTWKEFKQGRYTGVRAAPGGVFLMFLHWLAGDGGTPPLLPAA